MPVLLRFTVFIKYVTPEDIHVYRIDESFLDVTPYLKHCNMTARELAKTIIQDTRNTVGTISTCGIGTNLYPAKITLNIQAKHAQRPSCEGMSQFRRVGS